MAAIDDAVSGKTQSHEYPHLRRWNTISAPSIVVKRTKLNHRSSSDDLELLSIKRTTSHSYASLKDLIPSTAVNSPKPNSAQLGRLGSDISDISIRNRLVKQAAWAYLQPMSSSPDSTGGGLFHLLWPRVAAFFDSIRQGFIRIFDRALRVIRIRGSR